MAVGLSDRQMRILRLRADGLSGPQIARAECIAVGTLDWHERVIRTRLGAGNMTHAVHLAYQTGLWSAPAKQRHGDHAGFRAHERRGEDPWVCEPCAAGERAYRAGRKAASLRAPVPPVAAPVAPEPRPSAAGASGGDVPGFVGHGSRPGRARDSRPDHSGPQEALSGPSRRLAASAGPVPPSSPHAPATATTAPRT